MLRRVVVGGSPLGRRLARVLAERPGELVALVAEADAAERLREDGIAAETIDVTDPAALTAAAGDPAVVVLVSERPTDDAATLAAVETAFADAWIAAISPGTWPTGDGVDQHIRTEKTTASAIVAELLDEGFGRSLELGRTIAQLDGPLAVVMHDNPDPDAIASALGIVHIAESVGIPATPLYGGEITHQENRAFVNLLDLDLETYDGQLDADEWAGIALVDHAHPGVNDQLEPTTAVDIVVDHHPAREEAEATFVDRRHDVGATSTLVADHLQHLQVEPDRRLASALWYGIQVDTDRFSRGVSKLDFAVAARLRPLVDVELLERIEAPQMTATTIDTIGTAIDARAVHDDVLIADIGELADRDALAQAADALLRMAGITTVLVFGRRDETIYASARSRSDRVDVGDAMRLAFGQIGNAGGHDDMAGAQIPMGMLDPHEPEADPASIHDVVTDRFIEGVEMASRPLPSGYIADGDELP